MKRGTPGAPPPRSEVTPEALYLRRRELVKGAALFAATASGVGGALTLLTREPGGPRSPSAPAGAGGPPRFRKSRHAVAEAWTSFEDATTYNNYYELGTGKADPARNAHTLRPRPWTVAIDGEVARPQRLDVERLIGSHPLEERVYRLRCVEAWSMVLPWLGFPLARLLEEVEPTPKARYVAFETLHDPVQLPGQRRDVLPWPYVEGLRLDEAMHPLTFLAVGLYGKWLPNQNGAPLRLVVPWKYGFKGIKSIVRMTLTETEPKTSWSQAAPREYGFYANVNPAVDHPRWSQATERRVGELKRRPTLLFNGYGDEVAHLYKGMNLAERF